MSKSVLGASGLGGIGVVCLFVVGLLAYRGNKEKNRTAFESVTSSP